MDHDDIMMDLVIKYAIKTYRLSKAMAMGNPENTMGRCSMHKSDLETRDVVDIDTWGFPES